MAKKPGKKKPESAGAVAVKSHSPAKAVAKKKKTPPLTAAKLHELAAKYPPPQSWFEEDLDAI
jgi:hypothetical protein